MKLSDRQVQALRLAFGTRYANLHGVFLTLVSKQAASLEAAGLLRFVQDSRRWAVTLAGERMLADTAHRQAFANSKVWEERGRVWWGDVK